MHSKLTLRIQEHLIKAAKKYSKAHGKSLSQLIANYLYLIAETTSPLKQTESVPPLTKSLKGILRGKKVSEADYKKYLENKHQ